MQPMHRLGQDNETILREIAAKSKDARFQKTERGKFANYIAPPQKGPNDTPLDFEYVKFH